MPPSPAPEAAAAYPLLHRETEIYERAARDYRDALATIVTVHYEERRRALLGRIDRELGAEQTQLRRARESAVRRLEDFVARHVGPNAHPQATPDAMYRLAALYEEGARTADDSQEGLAAGLRPAISLYKRIIGEFPAYGELASVYYFLGHALGDAGRVGEAQQVFRSLVCRNHYPYPVASSHGDPDVDVVAPMPQDHDAAYWTAWRRKYDRPDALKGAARGEVTFEDPYPADCRAVQPGAAKYVAEIWWRIGDWEFDQSDIGGGVTALQPTAVWDYDRAASAYGHALEQKKPPIYGIALYKYAWTLFKQQRYEAAVHAFVALLRHEDESQRATGERGADFHQEACTYIAGSLAELDFRGPGPNDPYVARPDPLETARTPVEAEAKLRVALERVEDPTLVPQNEPWTIDIYRALALEVRSLGYGRSALWIDQLVLDKWPLHPSAPDTQNAIAETYEELASQTRAADEREGYERQVLAARTALWRYVGDSPWVDANKDDPPALHRAEALVRTGLRGAAAAHTRNGQRLVDQADQTLDRRERAPIAARALDEYRLASIGWGGVVTQQAQHPDAPDAYRNLYFLADALHQKIRLAVILHGLDAQSYAAPGPEDVAAAMEVAVAVRDSDEDDTFVANAGLFAVDLADVARDLAPPEARSGPRLEARTNGAVVVVEAIPEALTKGIRARDEYIRRVAPERDIARRALDYAFYSGEQFFLYGHFDEARARLEPIYREHCGHDAFGYEAWKRLVVMSNLARDAVRSRELAKAEKSTSCAWTDAQKAEERLGGLTDGVIHAAAFDEARNLYEQGRWTQACDADDAAAREAPEDEAAPTATLLAAYACAQAGRRAAAIGLYERFVERYGRGREIDALSGSARERRIRELGVTYDALSAAYCEIFAFDKAAQSFARTAIDGHVDDARRAAAARSAMVIYEDLGDRDGVVAMRTALTDPRLRIDARKRAEAEYVEASFDYERYVRSGDDGARQRAILSLVRFHEIARSRPEAAPYALEAAYRVARLTSGPVDRWWKAVVADWEALASQPSSAVRATDAPYAQYGAEAEFTLIDNALRYGFDGPRNRPRYQGTVAQVSQQVARDLEQVAKAWAPRLHHVAVYGSLEWAAAATAREGSLYDAIRVGLDAVSPVYFTPQQETVFARLKAAAERLASSGQPTQADALEQQIGGTQEEVRDAWRIAKQRYLDACTRRMMDKYVTAAAVARSHSVDHPVVRDALGRLAYYGDYLGDDVMRTYVEEIADPSEAGRKLTYTDGEFLRWRPGVIATPPPEGRSAPLPAPP
jgi:tetratricopeptide (TPR) repeat protein